MPIGKDADLKRMEVAGQIVCELIQQKVLPAGISTGKTVETEDMGKDIGDLVSAIYNAMKAGGA